MDQFALIKVPSPLGNRTRHHWRALFQVC